MCSFPRLGLTMVVLFAAASSSIAEQSLVKRQTPLGKPGTHGGFPSFAISPDGKLIAGGTGTVKMTVNGRTSVGGGEVLLWNAGSGKLLKSLGNHGDSVRWVGFSNDGKVLVSASRENGVVKVWQMAAGKLRHTLDIGALDEKTDLRWPRLILSDDGSTLVTIAARNIALGEKTNITTGGELTAWDLNTGKKLWSKPESDAYMAALTPNGRGMVTVQQKISDVKTDDKGRMRFRTERALVSWNVKTGEELATAEVERLGNPSAMKLLDPTTVALVTSSGLSIRDRNTGEATHEIKWHEDRTFADVVIGEEGKRVGRAQPGFIEVVDIESGETLGLMTTEFPNHLFNVTFSPDLQHAAGNQSGADGGPVLLELVYQPASAVSNKRSDDSAGQLAAGLRVTYFSDMKFRNELKSDVVKEPLNHLWTDAPIPGLPDDHWSSRYEGYLVIAEPGEYEFHLRTDDGSRLYINDEQVIDNWGNHAVRTRSAKVRLAAGKHPLRIDHYDHLKDAHMRFLWTDPKSDRQVPVPLEMLRHEPSDTGAVAAAD